MKLNVYDNLNQCEIKENDQNQTKANLKSINVPKKRKTRIAIDKQVIPKSTRAEYQQDYDELTIEGEL